MFEENNSLAFGNKLLEIRKEMKLSRKMVSQLTGINPDTVRNIENGKCTPKLDTLSLLSKPYKQNILDLYLKHIENTALVDIYKRLEYLAVMNDSEGIINLEAEFKKNKADGKFDGFINPRELFQSELFLESQKILHSDTENKSDIALTKLVNSIKSYNRQFKLNEFYRYSYDYFEVRILYTIAVILITRGESRKGQEIIQFILEKYLSADGLNVSLINMYQYIRAISLISYCHYIHKEYSSSLRYAETGIEVCIKNSLSYNLPLLFFRKGTALLFLENNDRGYLKRAIYLLEILGEHDMADRYKTEAEIKLNTKINIDEDICF